MNLKQLILLFAGVMVGLSCSPVADSKRSDSTPSDTEKKDTPDASANVDSGTQMDSGSINDQDNDGVTVEEGDCDDNNEAVNPNAIEDLGKDGKGDQVDNDCDGETDEHEAECDIGDLDDSAKHLAFAINLCDERFLLNVEKNFSSEGGAVAYDTLKKMGTNNCLIPTQGSEMAVISTGPVGQKNPNHAIKMGGKALEENEPLPKYQGNSPSGLFVQPCCDLTQIVLSLRAPSNAKGFSFDFLFGSAEYDEWINKGFNDTFYAIVEAASINGGATTNVALDDNDKEISVNASFFEDDTHSCDEAGSGWEPEIKEKSGSTGWLRSSWAIVPNEKFKLTLSIHDETDCGKDSIVFLDNFKWSTIPVVPGTTPIKIE